MLNDQQYNLQQQETLVFEEQQLPLSHQEWQQLADIMLKSDYQHIVGGDANESHSVWVSRYHNDVESPQALSVLSDDIEAIVMSNKMRNFYQKFTGTNKLCLRRCQANRLRQGDYIGVHKDQDSSPEYLATIVFHFSDDYTGGYFQTHVDENVQRFCKKHFYKFRSNKRQTYKPKSYKPKAHMALVNSCSVPHQVTKVESGERLTLACFLSTSYADNKKLRFAFKEKK